VAENLQVKEVRIGEGTRARRYAVCFNPQEAVRQKAHRDELLAELEAELESLRPLPDKEHSKRTCALRASARYGRYLKQTRSRLAIDRAALKAAERLDGKFIVHSNDDTLSAADMALGYKQLQRVEEAWRSMKSGLNLRPVFHWAPHRIHAHVAITVLAGERLVPLPEGSRYLGFVFARADRPEQVETALRAAHRSLEFDIERGDT